MSTYKEESHFSYSNISQPLCGIDDHRRVIAQLLYTVRPPF